MTDKTLPFFEDFEVGDGFDAGEIKVTLEMIKDFASQYDPQPMHLDEQAGKESIFGELIGSGWHTAALSMRLMALAKPLGDRPIIGLEVQDFKFLAPLKPEDTLAVRGEIIKAWRSKTKPMGFFQVKIETSNQDGLVILSQTWTVILPTKD
ncbi:MAG: MaoC/PaaZ C-terminal domain-containing protein [Sphingomonadales bacterium]